MWRWSLISFVAIALYWGIYWLIAGVMPVGPATGFISGIPRIFDCLLGPIFSIAFISYIDLVLRTNKSQEEISVLGVIENIVSIFFFALSLCVGLFVGIVIGIGSFCTLFVVWFVLFGTIRLIANSRLGKWLIAADKN